MNINKINICNMALALMGADIISEMDEPSKEAKACKVFYENTKNKLLARYVNQITICKSLILR